MKYQRKTKFSYRNGEMKWVKISHDGKILICMKDLLEDVNNMASQMKCTNILSRKGKNWNKVINNVKAVRRIIY